MKELSERTKNERVAGKRARLYFAVEQKIPLHQIFTMFDGRVALVGIDRVADVVTVKVTSSMTGESATISEPILDFPSEALLAQCRMVAAT